MVSHHVEKQGRGTMMILPRGGRCRMVVVVVFQGPQLVCDFLQQTAAREIPIVKIVGRLQLAVRNASWLGLVAAVVTAARLDLAAAAQASSSSSAAHGSGFWLAGWLGVR